MSIFLLPNCSSCSIRDHARQTLNRKPTIAISSKFVPSWHSIFSQDGGQANVQLNRSGSPRMWPKESAFQRVVRFCKATKSTCSSLVGTLKQHTININMSTICRVWGWLYEALNLWALATTHVQDILAIDDN